MRSKGLGQEDVWLTKVPSVNGKLNLLAKLGRERGSAQPGHSRYTAEDLFSVVIPQESGETFPAASVPPQQQEEPWERRRNVRYSSVLTESEGTDWGWS